MRKGPAYYILTWAILILGVLLLARLAPVLYAPETMAADDFGRYWSSGKLFIAGENPYNLEKLTAIQEGAGADQLQETGVESQTLNPPWSLILFTPFSLLDYSLARLAWFIVSIALVVVSVRLFWFTFQGSDSKLGVALLIAFCFSPTYSALLKGQVTPWIVLGVAGLLLYWEGKLSVWLAGACLVLLSIKPQLFYLLWPAIGFWMIAQRRWKLFISAAVIGLGAISLTLLVNRQVFVQYITAVQDYPYDQWATPTIGSYLRFFWLGTDIFWVQYLPAVFGFGWLMFHFWRHRRSWIWREQIPLLSIVSLLTTPYAWTYDAIIILPAILLATSKLSKQNKILNIILWSVYLATNLVNLLLHTQLSDFWFLWLAPAFCVWYLAAMALPRQKANSLNI